jgi:hypothetical protein
VKREFITMGDEQKKIEIRMTFEGELAKRLNAVKEYYQVENYTDLIRFLITRNYEELKPLAK